MQRDATCSRHARPARRDRGRGRDRLLAAARLEQRPGGRDGHGAGSEHDRSRQGGGAPLDADWAAGKDALASTLTNHPVLAANGLGMNRKGLDGASVVPTIVGFQKTGRTATARLGITWNVAGYGPWHYKTTMHLRELASGRWVILWNPKIVWSGLTSATRLGTDRIDPVRASILDRTGKALIEPRPVVEVGLERDKVHDVTASATAHGEAARASTCPPTSARCAAPGRSSSWSPRRCGPPTTRRSRRRSRRSPARSRTTRRCRSARATRSGARCSAPSPRRPPSRSSGRTARSGSATTSASGASRPPTTSTSRARRTSASSRAAARPATRSARSG